ncbi:glycosyltransferase family 39 protein [Sphingomonas sp. RS6]
MAGTIQLVRGSWRPRRLWPAWLVPLALAAVIVALGPRLYTGGGGDDWYYLQAARCAAANGICLPDSHWAARFPLIVPMGLVLRWFGEQELSVALVPFCYLAAALLLFVQLIERLHDARTASIAGMVFTLTPLLPAYAGQPMVDVPEFAWTMAMLVAAERALAQRNSHRAVVAGAALALAVMTRLSSLSLLPLLAFGWLYLDRDRRRLAIPFVLAFVAILLAEAAAYAVATGDPLYGWGLSLHHTRLASSELPPGIGVDGSPILNLDLIRNWRRSMGIHVHWSVDPLLNLLADPKCGLTLCGATALALVRRRDWRRDRWLPAMAGAALLHFVLLTYVLAIDPKPRMFLPEVAVASATLGVLAVRGWRQSRLLIVALAVLLSARALAMAYDQPRLADARAVAAAWIAEWGSDALATDAWTRRTITIAPGAQALPLAEAAPMRLRLGIATVPCAGGRVVREAVIDARDGPLLAMLRAGHILLAPHPPLRLCLVAPSPPR